MDLLNLLKALPEARERKNKNRAITYVLKKRYGFLAEVDKKLVNKMVREVNTLDREWRKILQDNPELRGKDYNEKTKLEQAKQQELGYN